jgi:TolB protein
MKHRLMRQAYSAGPFGLWLLTFLIVQVSATIGAQDVEQLGVVRAREFQPLPIVVPSFEFKGTRRPENLDLAAVMTQDLKLSGFFKLPAEGRQVQDVNARDQQDGKIHFPEWEKLGVYYVVKGKYEVSGSQVVAEVRTYDVVAGTLIFGTRYEYSLDRGRQLAHRASNDIIKRITNFPGVAHTKILLVGEKEERSGDQIKEIYMMDADGYNLQKMTSDASLAATPGWGANATELYYTTYRDFNPDLAGMFLDGSYSWFISRRPGFNLSPSWSQVRKLVALTLTKDGNSEIYTMNREGKALKRITFHRAIDSSPSWSPTGDQIAFTSDRSGTPQIYVMDNSGVNVRRISHHSNYNDSPQWSPLGDKIAFASRINGKFQIFLSSPNGEDLQQLTFGNANCEDPTWAANGWVLAYTSDRSGRKQIYTMFVDGRPIAHLPTSFLAHSADWSPMLQ